MSALVNIEEIRRSACTAARTYKWDVFLSGASPGSLSKLGDRGGFLNLRCESLDQPNPTTTVIDVLIRGFTYKEAGMPEYNTISMNVVEVDNYPILAQLFAYHNEHADYITGHQRKKCDIEMTADIFLLDAYDVPQLGWKLIGVEMEGYTPPQLSNDKGGFWTGFSITLNYDYPILTLGNGDVGSGRTAAAIAAAPLGNAKVGENRNHASQRTAFVNTVLNTTL